MKILPKFRYLAFFAVLYSLGCKKESINKTSNSITTSVSAIPDSMTVTPYGLVPKSRVFLVENGSHLELRNGHVLKVQTNTGKLIRDLGTTRAQSSTSKITAQPSGGVDRNYIFDPSDIGGATIDEPNGAPVTYFSTSFTVPNNPTVNDNQLIFIFSALKPDDTNPVNIQPVLQYGTNSAAGGGYYWGIANWFIWDDATTNFICYAISPLITVTPGTVINSVINNTGVANGSYNFACSFSDVNNVPYSNTLSIVAGDIHQGFFHYGSASVAIPTIAPQYSANINFIHFYLQGIPQQSAFREYPNSNYYPPDNCIKMTNIKLLPNSATLNWLNDSSYLGDLGEHIDVINNNLSGNGEIDLWFHPQTPVISYVTPDTYTVNTPITFLNPVNTGAAATSYSISPALPAGLSMNTYTGVISGTPTVAAAAKNYSVTATNSVGNSSPFPINITVYAAPVLTAANGTIAGTVNFTVTPNIPLPTTGVLYYLNTTTGHSGTISGSPYGFTGTFTRHQFYQFYFIDSGSGTPSSAKSNTVNFLIN